MNNLYYTGRCFNHRAACCRADIILTLGQIYNIAHCTLLSSASQQAPYMCSCKAVKGSEVQNTKLMIRNMWEKGQISTLSAPDLFGLQRQKFAYHFGCPTFLHPFRNSVGFHDINFFHLTWSFEVKKSAVCLNIIFQLNHEHCLTVWLEISCKQICFLFFTFIQTSVFTVTHYSFMLSQILIGRKTELLIFYLMQNIIKSVLCGCFSTSFQKIYNISSLVFCIIQWYVIIIQNMYFSCAREDLRLLGCDAFSLAEYFLIYDMTFLWNVSIY
jgi:hypothetical protein